MVTESPGQAAGSSARPARTRRATRVGVVSSAKAEKTIKVTVSYLVRHPKYGKLLRRRSVLHAHDEKREAHEGDVVELAACRPMSKTKHWRLLRVVEKSKSRVSGGEAGPTGQAMTGGPA